MRRIAAIFAALLVLSLGATASLAETPQRAGRLSYMEGSVSVATQDDQSWAPAQLNLPVTTGTALWTEPGGRAEIEIGAATIRIDSETELDVARLDDQGIEISVPQGAVNIHRGAVADVPIWIDTPNGQVTLSQPGFYRVADGAVTPVGPNPSPFDQWAMARENAAAQAQAETLRYVSPQMTGYQDLGPNGGWTVTPEYGAVWYPRAVPVGWAPYRYGHWAYVFPWGWTWIDDAPWGFAPFHYGRWVFLHGRWGWWPGRVVARPVFVPAHVVFVVGGHDRHAPPTRWIPLAPRESAPRVSVNVHVDVNRFQNHAAVSARPVATVERQAQRGAATGPRGERTHELRAVSGEQGRAPAPANVRHEEQDRGPAPAAGRRDTTAPAPRAVERPQGPSIQRNDRGEDHRRPPETRIAPSVPSPDEKARLSAPANARREVTRDQPRPQTQAEAVAPRPQPAPEARRAPRIPPQHPQRQEQQVRREPQQPQAQHPAARPLPQVVRPSVQPRPEAQQPQARHVPAPPPPRPQAPPQHAQQAPAQHAVPQAPHPAPQQQNQKHDDDKKGG